MALLSKDNDIKQWFTKLLDDVIYYRKQTLKKMSNFYDEILDQHKYVKPHIMQSEKPQDKSSIAKIKIEYDITKICSDFN